MNAGKQSRESLFVYRHKVILRSFFFFNKISRIGRSIYRGLWKLSNDTKNWKVCIDIHGAFNKFPDIFCTAI